MRKYILLVLLFITMGSSFSHGADHIFQHVPDAEIVGHGRMYMMQRYLGQKAHGVKISHSP